MRMLKLLAVSLYVISMLFNFIASLFMRDAFNLIISIMQYQMFEEFYKLLNIEN